MAELGETRDVWNEETAVDSDAFPDINTDRRPVRASPITEDDRAARDAGTG